MTSKRGGIRYAPMAFTEQGVAMLSSVLNSDKAIKVTIPYSGRDRTEVEGLRSELRLRLAKPATPAAYFTNDGNPFSPVLIL